MSETSVETLKCRLRKFAADRNWGQFHSPKNLVMALSTEIGELSECFQWLTMNESKNLSPKSLQAVKHELADIFIYLIRLADQLGVDLIEVATDKISINEQRYPVEKSRGVAKKYTELD